ncbi:hypothetical protein BFC22_06860 [Carnobacterium divergens]|uniref:hypothetical protein n=1 Tax=Carnobacterium divergens TaxID=2748 RepID=UPI000E767C73|nr:hypothetical protein [Carnobacterium divergens]ANZ99834.1 hypothetical protein BFC22_06860 [Carnobacterium divergens]
MFYGKERNQLEAEFHQLEIKNQRREKEFSSDYKSSKAQFKSLNSKTNNTLNKFISSRNR